MKSFFVYAFLIFFVCSLKGHAQNLSPKKLEVDIHFKANPKQKFGFDSYETGKWEKSYAKFEIDKNNRTYLAHKSVGINETDLVDVIVKSKLKINLKLLKFEMEKKELAFKQVNDSLFTLNLPKKNQNYYVLAFYKEKLLAKLFVSVLNQKVEKVIIVPLIDVNLNPNQLEEEINKIYRQANLKVQVSLKSKFKSKVFSDSSMFTYPENEHKSYSGQMRLLRNLYFESNPKADKKANYLFIIPQFSDTSANGFMARNKSFALATYNENKKQFAISLARTLAFGLGKLNDSWLDEGPEKGSTLNLMDTTLGVHLNHIQWLDFQNSAASFSFYDNEEYVKTNNGTVAFYFWEEDILGNIKLDKNHFLSEINRPYKKNFLSYRFNVKYALLKPFYKIGRFYITIINIILLLIIVLLFNFFRNKLKSFWLKKSLKRKFWRRILYLPLIVGFTYLLLFSFDLSNLVLDQFAVVSGPLPELENLTYEDAKRDLFRNKQLSHKEEYSICSEILIRKRGKWSIKKRKRVLYFDLETSKGKKSLKLVLNSDSLKLETLNQTTLALSHYFVINFKDSAGKVIKQKVYNHSGKNVTENLIQEDPPKRILLFVNGYRPTSLGHTFEENFNDIQKKGLEFPNSRNLIYDFDRYDYWEQWNQINLLFQNRINPNESYYADGHFSVSTSNYRSILNFSSFSRQYPKRCKNQKKHVCYSWKNPSIKDRIFNDTKTIKQLKNSSNRKGFNLRRKKGRLAGRNLVQVLNDIPNRSSNDTIYIVAHSMGFAYALGIVDELKGKIKFGGFYIIAPENAKAGKIKQEDWQEVWQYGVNFNKYNFDAPCLQDGVAPQTKVSGLSDNKRVYFPKSLYQKKGFFDSHFIGHYTWILKIPEGKKGSIKQR